MTRSTLNTALAALAAVSFTGAVQAQSAMSHSPMSHPKMSGSTRHQRMITRKVSPSMLVGYCAKCKVFYSKSDAMKMGMKDGMGHKMTMVPISKVPIGTTMGHKM